jgi:hypothetical protein
MAGEASAAYPITKLASRLLALTVLRPGTLRTTDWAELQASSEDAPVWRVPADRMKLKAARKKDERFDFLVPLSRQAMEVLQAARTFAPRGPLVFRSQRHAHKPISENAIGYFYNYLAAPARHVPRGWRSTFSTVMNERAQALNRPSDRAIIDLMPPHIPDGAEATYNRAAYLPHPIEIAQEWADLLVYGCAPAAELLEGPRREACRRGSGGMTARSLHEVIGGKASRYGISRNRFRRDSFLKGSCEIRFWRLVNKRQMVTAEGYDRQHKQPSKRNGPLGHVGLEVLRALHRVVCHRPGRLEPSIDVLMGKLRRSRDATVRALKSLKDHGLLDWVRRT